MTKRELIELLEASELEDIDEILIATPTDFYRPVAIDPKTRFIIVEPA